MADFFIRRPIVAIVIAIITVIAGLVSLLGLPVAQFPDIVPPLIQVNAVYTGADAVTIEKSVIKDRDLRFRFVHQFTVEPDFHV